MGIEDITNKAKDLASENAEKIKEGVDVAADKIKGLVPDEHGGKVDQAADAVKGVVDSAGGSSAGA